MINRPYEDIYLIYAVKRMYRTKNIRPETLVITGFHGRLFVVPLI